MSQELKELIEQQVSYYRHHGVGAMIERKPGFVEEDFTKLLKMLEEELENER